MATPEWDTRGMIASNAKRPVVACRNATERAALWRRADGRLPAPGHPFLIPPAPRMEGGGLMRTSSGASSRCTPARRPSAARTTARPMSAATLSVCKESGSRRGGGAGSRVGYRSRAACPEKHRCYAAAARLRADRTASSPEGFEPIKSGGGGVLESPWTPLQVCREAVGRLLGGLGRPMGALSAQVANLGMLLAARAPMGAPPSVDTSRARAGGYE